jgi:hypothetical protein
MEQIGSNEILLTAPPAAKNGVDSLAKLEQCHALTPEGRKWFTIATDPFHDEKIEVAGYPDTNVTSSIVQTVKQQSSIACPAAITTGTWDVNIVMWPYAETTTNTVTRQRQNGVISPGGTISVFAIGGVTALAAQTPSGTYGSGAVVYDLITPTLGNDIDVPGYVAGASRIIGMGLEVVNTTAPLYKQGQCTVWRQPVTPGAFQTEVNAVANVNATVIQYGQKVHVTAIPPGTLANATLLAGSNTWEAEKGAYVVNTLAALDVPVINPMPLFAVVVAAEPVDGASPVVSVVTDVPVNVTVGTGAVVSVNNRHVSQFNMCGAYFTGLSLQTTLQVRSIYYVERFPTPLDQNLVVLSTPSPGFDPCALELYARTLSSLPVGVPSGENPLGEWFRDVVNKVSSFTTPILKTLAPMHPVLGGMALASQAAGALSRGNTRKAARAGKNLARATAGKGKKKKTNRRGTTVTDIVNLRK